MRSTEAERYGAVEKCRAVLAVWTERKQASALCREMTVSASLFSQWQDRALAGILEALEPRGTRTSVEGPALPVLVRRLLDRKVRARELESLGRSAQWRVRPQRGKTSPPPAASPAAS